MDRQVPASEPIEEAAARWFFRRHSGKWNDADQARFDEWLGAATAHRVQYLRVSGAWTHSARMQALGAGIPSGVIPPRGSWGNDRFFGGTARTEVLAETPVPPPSGAVQSIARPPGRRQFLAVAASAAIALLGGFLLYTAGYFTADGAHHSTPVGGLEDVPLADGSRVTLNTDTSIRVQFGEDERRILLDKGEAFFDVAKDKSRPFVVEAGDRRVVAVGTRFSVRRDRDDIQVVVTEGRVELMAADGAPLRTISHARPAVTADAGAESIPRTTVLDAGAIARTSSSEVLVRPHTVSEAQRLLTWRNGYVYFEDMALTDAIAEFNRYNTRKIAIEDPAIANLKVGGNFRSSNVDAFLDLLQNGFAISVVREDDRIVLKGR